MAATLRWNGRVVLALLVLLGGLLLSISMGPGGLDNTAPDRSSRVLEAPRLTLTLGRSRISVAGTSQSTEHETVIDRVIEDRFPRHEVARDYRPGVGVPEHWETVSTRALYVMAAMESATAIIEHDRLHLQGVTIQPQVFRQRLDFLREAMPGAAAISDDVIVIDNAAASDALCRRWFTDLGSLPVSFTESSTDLRSSSYPSLDKLADFAWHCSRATILIAGHTDASGNEAWNLQLSRARAQAVANYLQQNGVASERLIVEGRGSQEPIADNATRYGRSQNRRIEFELREPLF